MRAFSASAAASFLLALCTGGGAQAQIYSHIDARGLIHITNVPRLADHFTARNPSAKQARQRYRDIVEEAAQRYQVSPTLIHAVILTESSYRPDAVSRKGAVGLMQLMPPIAQRYGVTDLRDPLQNIHGGTRYLRDLLQLFNNDLGLALAAYNAGEAAVIRHGGIPPYAETAQYVLKVLGRYSGM